MAAVRGAHARVACRLSSRGRSPIRRSELKFVAALVALFAGGAPVCAQIVAPSAGPRPFLDYERPIDRVSLSLYGAGRAAFDADLDDGGSVAVHRAGGGADLSIPISEGFRGLVGVGGESSFYDFDFAPGVLPGSDPFDDLHRLSLDLGVSHNVSQRWSWAVTGRAEWAAQSGAEVDESLLGAGFARARYAFNENNFGLSFGLIGQTRLESDARVFPIVGFDWRVNENLAVYTTGPGLTVAAEVAEGWVISAKGRWESREYRLDDEGPLPGGVLEDERIVIGAEVMWRPRPRIEAAFEIGGVVYQEFEALDSGGGHVSDDETDPALFVAGRLVLRF